MAPQSCCVRSQKKQRELEKTEKEKENKEILAYQDEEIIFNNHTNQLAI
jgi:hypothetical protein